MDNKIKDLKNQIKILKEVCEKYQINLKYTPYRRYLKEEKGETLTKIERNLTIQFQ